MALELTGRNPAKFVFDDGIQKTEVVIQPDDEPDVVRAKLQRVLELEGVALPAAPPVRMISSTEPIFTPADRAAMDERLAQTQPMGWTEDAAFDDLPEA